MIVHVPPRLPGTAWQHKGRFLKRAGDELTAFSDTELRTIFAETGPDFSAEICPAATLADLDSAPMADFRARWARKAVNPRIATWDDRQTLTDAELLIDGRLTYAALILFGSRAALGRHLAQAEVIFEYRSSEASGPAQDRTEYREGFSSATMRFGKRSTFATTGRVIRTGCFATTSPPSTRPQSARRSSTPSPIATIA